jgi:hypothetical protein
MESAAAQAIEAYQAQLVLDGPRRPAEMDPQSC